LLTVARRTVAGGSIEITRRVVTRLGRSIAQLGRNVTVLRRESGLAAAHSCQLVGPGVFSVLGGLRSIFGCNFAVVDSLGAIVRGPSASRRASGAFGMLTLARGAITGSPVEITLRVVTRFGFSVT